MSQTSLRCLSGQAAATVVEKVAEYVGDRAGACNTVRADGPNVVIDYADKRFPLDVADMAAGEGYASDREAAAVMAQL